MTNMVQFNISMKKLFELTDNSDAEFEIAQDISSWGFEIQTPQGWQPIQALVRKHTDSAKYMLQNGDDLTCATHHLVFENGECKSISQCSNIDTLAGSQRILGTQYLGKQILYDVAIQYPHVYVTTNGILHHNTTLARCLFAELEVNEFDIRYVNASHHTGVDYFRGLQNFIETMPSGRFRYVLLDECLDEDTIVWVLRNGTETGVAIKDLDQSSDLVKSYSVENQRIEWRPFELMDKGDREVLEIEFDNSEVVICTPNHKWYVRDPGTGETKVVRADELDQYNHILTI